MKKSRFGDGQIMVILKQAEAGARHGGEAKAVLARQSHVQNENLPVIGFSQKSLKPRAVRGQTRAMPGW